MEKEYKLVIAGDLLPSGTNIRLFEEGNVKKIFGEEICNLFAEADYSIFNLEGPLTDSEEKQEKVGPIIKAPSKTINGIKNIGGTKLIAALANNHITDYGQQGFNDTIEALQSAGISYVGAGTNEQSIKKYITLFLGKRVICIYNVSEKFFNAPDENSAGANIYDEYIVCNDLRNLKPFHDYIIVIYHGGAEYFQYPTPLISKRFHRMADCGADFIVSQHTHCIGCEEHYKNSFFIHGQGNFLFSRQKMYPALTKKGLVLELVFKCDEIKITKHLVQIEGDTIRLVNNPDFSDFERRSSEIYDKEMIEREYTKLKVDEIMTKFLSAAKGNELSFRIIRKFFPKKLKDYLKNSYSRSAILLNLCAISQDRRNEDMYYVWRSLLNNRKKT